MNDEQWTMGFPAGLVKEGHRKFLVRGTQDPEADAIPILVVEGKPMTDTEKAISHAMVGLKWSLIFAVKGDGNDFAERPAWELEGALWKKRE